MRQKKSKLKMTFRFSVTYASVVFHQIQQFCHARIFSAKNALQNSRKKKNRFIQLQIKTKVQKYMDVPHATDPLK